MSSILLLLVLNTITLPHITAQLDEAEAYLIVNSAQSLKVLQDLQISAEYAPELHLRRAMLMSRATVATNQLDLLLQVLDEAFNYSDAPAFKSYIPAFASALGIWLRRNQYLVDAQTSLNCAIKYADTERQRLTLTNSMALIARQLEKYEEARQLFMQVSGEALKHDQPHLLAVAENNLGLIALDEGKLDQAEGHFRAALRQYQLLDHRAGKISAGLNLMFYFLLQNELQNYERIAKPTETLTNHFPNTAKQEQLLWLQYRYAQLKGGIITIEQQARLKEGFSRLEDAKAQQLIARYLATEMTVDVQYLIKEVPNNRFESKWFNQLRDCNW